MRINFSFFILVAAVFPGFLSCDNERNIDKPENNYFIKYYGEDGSQSAVDMIVNDDGSVVILGKSDTGDKHIFLVKTDSKGSIIWQKSFGGVTDDPKDIEATRGGNYIILSDYEESPGNIDIRLLLVTEGGVEINNVIHGSPYNDHSNSITQLADEGFVIAGYSDFDWQPNNPQNVFHNPSFMHFRCDKDLVFFNEDTWRNYFGAGKLNVVTKIIQVRDSLYVFGFTDALSEKNPNEKKVLIYYSITSEGINRDGLNYLGEIDEDTQSNFVMLVPPSLLEGFFIVGTSSNYGGSTKLHISKLKNPLYFNDNDDKQFDRNLADGNLADRKLTGIAAAPSLNVPEGYLVVSNETDPTGSDNILLSKIDKEGNDMWSTSFGGSKEDTAAGVMELPDGKILILCTIQLDIQKKIALLKVNSKGQFLN